MQERLICTWKHAAPEELSSKEANELQLTVLDYWDPVDRILVAGAKAFDMAPATPDKRLFSAHGSKVWLNRQGGAAVQRNS